ncbi:hypothetical protein RB601_006143 [Gaeumannomyces tritici]
MAHKTSAIQGEEPVEVLFALQNKFDLLDLAGPVAAMKAALHDKNDPNTTAFEITLASAESTVLSDQGVIINSQITFKEAHERLKDFDVLVIVGGDSDNVIKTKAEPLSLITKFSEIQKEDPARERTVLSICTGSLFLAQEGILAGLSGTTHPDFMTAFENLCSHAAVRNLAERTDVIEDARYVVNNLRFDLGDEDENPYVHRKTDKADGRRPSNARYEDFFFLACMFSRGYKRLTLSPRKLQQGQYVLQELRPPRVHHAPRRDAPGRSPGHHERGKQRWH